MVVPADTHRFYTREIIETGIVHGVFIVAGVWGSMYEREQGQEKLNTECMIAAAYILQFCTGIQGIGYNPGSVLFRMPFEIVQTMI
jgi:hypothetical protein